MNKNILLIDDDPDDHEIFNYALEMAFPDVNCEHAFDCLDAVERIKKGIYPHPDSIFVDVNMPAMEFPKCLFSINEALGASSAEIIILTGFQLSDLPSYDALGILKVISKPSSVEMLAEKLRETMVIQ
ncbi:response regulator [Dyadobacter sp. CY326]|uniref:response regulator n=1 Tax=Dyadobacter sp. CY326 TaxID=2907300 RepID=UPI001F40296F|nr:response regulator [Dyadobacter sp. CY326]MCE7064593.1 response regulator [Dyadobacter sp. CY326]